MNNEIFEIVVLSTKVLLSIIGALVAYKFIPYLQANTTVKQREDAEYWARKAILIAEDIYRDKGQGILKKESVIEWLAKNKINITASQADILIDLIVKEFNKVGWPI